MAGEAGAVVEGGAEPITVPAEEDDNEEELMMETAAGSVAYGSAEATSEIDELVEAAEVDDELEEEVEDEESPAFLLARFLGSFFSLSVGSLFSFLERLLLLSVEVNALSFDLVIALVASISSNNFISVTEKGA